MGKIKDQVIGVFVIYLITQSYAIILKKDIYKRSITGNFTCPQPTGLFRNTEDCTTYFNCYESNAHKQKCQLNFVFNEKTGACDYPDNVPGCGSDVPIREFFCPKSNGHFPNADNCLEYYMCKDGSYIKMTCPVNLVFNSGNGQCDYPENVPSCKIEIKGEFGMEVDFSCPSSSGLFRNPLDCTSFYQCWLGKPTKQKCSPGFAFDENLGFCVLYYQSLACRGTYYDASKVSSPYTSKALSPSGFRCQQENGLFSHPNQCEIFYMCINYVAYMQSCPTPLVFNPKISMCDYRHNVPGCGADKTLVAAPYSSATFSCPKSNGQFRNPTNCGSFYKCVDNRASIQFCQAGLYFNPMTGWCDWPASVPECSSIILPRPTLPPIPGSLPSGVVVHKCKGLGLFPNPDDCGSFFHCGSGGTVTIEYCPSSLVFSDRTNRCDYPDKVPGCYKKSDESNLPPRLCKVQNEVSEYPGDCSRYYLCIDGKATEQRCAPGFVFDRRTGICSWLHDAPECCIGCGSKKNLPIQQIQNKIIPPCHSCGCPEPYGEFPNPYDCHSFYHCSHNIAYVKPCPSNLVFNPRLKVCDWPSSVPGCGGIIVPTVPPPNWQCPSPNGKFKNPSDCSSYFHCNIYVWNLVKCQAGLFFNDETEQCDWQHNVPRCAVPGPPSPPGPKPIYNCPCCKRPTGQFRNTQNCNSFYNCWQGTAWEQSCAANLVFNEATEACDYPSEVPECGGGPRPLPDPGYRCPSVGIFPNPQDCSVFYICGNKNVQVKRCSAGLVFNSRTLNCDWASNVHDCNAGKPVYYSAVQPSISQAPVQPSEFRCPRPKGLYINPRDCASFYNCGEGYYAWKQNCPNGLFFSEPLQRCEWPGNVPRCGIPNPPAPPGPPVCTITHLYRNKYDCTSYFQCVNGRQHEFRCQSGLFFNENKQCCDYPDNVPECKQPGPGCPCVPNKTPAPPTPPPCDPECYHPDGCFPVISSCKTYYRCFQCKKILQYCGEGLAFDARLGICAREETVEGCAPPTVPPPDCRCPYPDGKFPVEDDCTSFINCDKGQAFVLKCPGGLVFNPVTKCCDYPINVPGCGCPEPTPPPTLPPIPTPGPPCPPIDGICKYPNGVFKDEVDDCRSFILCLNWQAFKLTCPVGSAFNPEKKICDWSYKIEGCGGSDVLPPFKYQCIREGFYPVNGDCTAYWCCFGNPHGIFMRCDPGMAFSTETFRCELWARVTNCKVCPVCPPITTTSLAPTTTTTTTRPTTRTTPTTTTRPPTCCQDLWGNFRINCTHFCNCFDGVGNVQKCPEGLAFNPRTSNCDVSINVPGCCPTPTQPEEFKCPVENGIFPHPTNCELFYICCNFKVYPRSCPAGLHFDSVAGRCDFNWKVTRCGPGPVPPPTCNPEPPQIFRCPKGTGYFQDPKNCRNFYVCCNWFPFKLPCPENTAFNEDKQICDWPGNVPGCVIPGPNPTPPGPAFICPHDGNFPYAGDCTAFWCCTNRKANFQKCSPGTGFNPAIRQCDWLSNIQYCACPICPAPGPLPVCDQKCPTPYGLHKGPTCGTYYNCAACTAHLQSCPDGLAFNSRLSYCDWPNKVPGCENVKPIGPTFNCPSHSGLYPHSWDCKKYFVCWNGVSTLGTCPKGLEFNNAQKRCDFPWNVPKCGGKNDINVCRPDGRFRCPANDGLFAVQNECNNYYHCANGNAVLLPCPPNTAFNAASKICDWVWHVPGCTGLVLPTLNPVTFFCPHDGNWAVNGDCSAFWECKGMKPKFKRCIPGMVYNKDSRECDFWKNVKGGCVCPICPAPAPLPVPIDPNCPTPFGHYPGQVCGTYYNCYEGKGHLQHCPRGLVFNPLRNYCDYACHVPGCQHVTAPPDPVIPCQSDDFVPHPDDCSSYFCCHNGISSVIKCPLGLVFNPATKQCDYVWCVKQCGGIDPPPQPPKPPAPCVTVPPHIFKCPSESGKFRDIRKCNTYFECIRGDAYERFCPEKLAYNQQGQICDWPQNVKGCGGPIVPDPPSNYICPHDGNFGVAGECTAYWQCINGRATLKRCCPGMAFNPSSHQCDWWVNVHDCYYPTCPVCPRPPITDIDNPNPAPGFRCPRPTGQFCNPDDCTTFYNCWQGSWYLQRCPEGLAFNGDKMWCDWPENVPGCGHITQPPRPPVEPWVCPSFGCSYPNPYDCNSFYFCLPNGPELRHCPYGLVFNPRTLNCDNQLNVPECCVKPPGPTPGPPPTPRPPPPPCPYKCTEQEGKFPHETNCEYYYWCICGASSLHQCPSGSLFNPRKQECDLPCNVPECQHPCPTPPPPPIPDCPKEGIFYRDCQSYKLCCGGKISIHYCSPTLFFNPRTLLCDYPYNVPECCTPVTTIPTTVTTTCADPRCYGMPNGIQIFCPTDCTYIDYCENGCIKRRYCNYGLKWNNQIKQCDSTPVDPYCNPITTTTTVKPGDRRCDGIPCDVKYCSDCKRYWWCTIDRVYHEDECRAPTPWWNKNINWCDSVPVDRYCYPITTTTPVATTTDPRCNGLPCNVKYCSDCKRYWWCTIDKVYHEGECRAPRPWWNRIINDCDSVPVDPYCYPITTTVSTTTTDPRCNGVLCEVFFCSDCQLYWWCTKDRVYQERRCQWPNPWWNRNTNKCGNEPVDQYCLPITTTVRPTTTDPRCNGVTCGVYFCSDCQLYWWCSEDRVYHEDRCQWPTPWWNRNTNKCGNEPVDQYCYPIPTTTTTTAPPCNCPYQKGYNRDFSDCNKYFQCLCGEIKHLSCAEKLVFDLNKLECVWPETLEKTDRCYKPREDPPCLCQGLNNAYYIFPNDCTRFVVCLNGKPYNRRCPPGLFFNRKEGYCDIASNVPECCACTPPENLKETALITAVSVRIAPNGRCSKQMGNEGYGDCSQYYLCLDYQPVLQKCTNSLVFNPEINSCDWPENVPRCKVTMSRYVAHRLSGPSFTCSSPYGLFANSNDCSSYFFCLNGKPLLRFCPPALYFNKNTSSCDWPANVQCNNQP